MKTKTMLKLKLTIAVAALVTVLGACNDGGSVPSAYQGEFADQAGVKLDLTGNEAELVVDGKTLKGSTAALSYDALMSGAPGFYIESSEDGPTLVDVYWITPDLSSKKTAGDLVYYTTDIVYLQIDLNRKDAVSTITIVHSAVGTVMLDTKAQTWQSGWPARAEQYSLVRTATAGNISQ